ncbi:MAG: hypothetical protein WAM91_00590 [Candidatus Acidiferrales bacterium]
MTITTSVWKEICKFLAGAFFVSSGVLFYLYLAHIPVPLLGTHWIVQPAVNGLRAIVHGVLCVLCLYFGFVRR